MRLASEEQSSGKYTQTGRVFVPRQLLNYEPLRSLRGSWRGPEVAAGADLEHEIQRCQAIAVELVAPQLPLEGLVLDGTQLRRRRPARRLRPAGQGVHLAAVVAHDGHRLPR